MVEIYYEARVKVIRKRWLWLGYNFKKFKYESIFDKSYYIEQIQRIKEEAYLFTL
jgi:hypothetical protein